ncbi:uncharacterized protein A1O9_11921 [Exophiala aquamarina CBS 119918]|uniref:MutL C-terminal dimerisation domain-containing protein n=1 Tax=Exophiala aquamarina CBS 119918 TaxID=1182545 RepID=A0A072NWE4_9EURO|nr:uncharacterized protein A1O9_11921 [Exophiala aquamarina CBS 119918]KEF51931.1 hypothetical protein A1O9_11921 [Exophiala aquamarina CBS 119918]
MAESSRRIHPLSDDVRAQLSSSIEITSHEQVMTGLLENALDANARFIAIYLNLARGYFSVLDDGMGIRKVEFSQSGYLGQINCQSMSSGQSTEQDAFTNQLLGTSKSESSVDSYGRFGRFLSYLSVIALLSITSRHKSETRASRLILRRGQVVHRNLSLDESGIDIGRSGTKIEVHNLFGDIPVRSKHMYARFSSTAEIERTFDLLRRVLTGYLLAYSGQIDLSCILSGTSRKLVHRRPNPLAFPTQVTLEMVTSVLSQTKSGSAVESKSWRFASVRTAKYFISAAISVEPAPSPYHQYLSLGNIPVHARGDHNLLLRTINDQFQRSNFGKDFNVPRSESTETMLQRMITENPGPLNTTKSVDRWPMFYIRVDGLPNHEARELSQDTTSFTINNVNNSITRALDSLVSHFLDAEHLKPASMTTRPQKLGRSHQSYGPNINLPALMRRSELANLDTTSQISQWHRIKSGRSKPEDIDYGLPFAKSTRNHHTQTDLARDSQLLYDNLSSDEIDLDIPISEESLSTSDKGSTSDLGSHTAVERDFLGESSVWTNPRDGRTVHVDSRTGATISASHQQLNATMPLNSQVVRSTKKYQTHTLGLHHPDKSTLAQPHADRARNLKPYGEGQVLRREAPIATIGTGGPLTLDETGSPYLFQERNQVSKEDLAQAKVLGQVDRKFILITLNNLVILIDQHAADERVKLEHLCQELCIGNPSDLERPLVFEIEEDETALFKMWQGYFHKWQIKYEVQDVRSKQRLQDQVLRQGFFSIRVDALPKLIAERCRAEPRLLIELLRNELFSNRAQSKLETCSQTDSRLESRRSWLSIAASCPVGVLELLKSRSCRTAIMFNDILDVDECEELVKRLSKCDLPFQCAHGRPTLTVLTDVGLLGQHPENRAAGAEAEALGYRTLGFGAAWQKWISRS